MNVKSPSQAPVCFSIDAAESARLREVLFATGGGRPQLLSAALLLLLGILNASSLARLRGWQDPLTFVPALLYVANVALMVRGTFARCTVRVESGTMLTFDDTGMSIERNAGALATHIPFARIRSVRRTPDIIGMHGIRSTYVTLPTSALPDGGIQLVGFLRDRIVSKGMPDNSSHGVTTIFNSVSPVLARR